MTTPPMVDIILPTKDESALFQSCLASLKANTPDDLYRLIVVDDGSEVPVEKDCADIVVRSQTSKGLVSAANYGIAIALQDDTSMYLLLLCDDTRVPDGDRGWLKRMLEELEQGGAGCAAVGATSNVSNMPQHILTVPQVFLEDWKDEDGRRGGLSYNPTVPWFTSFGVLLRKSAIAQCGLLDVRFDPAGYEDVDYALQLRAANYTIRVARSVYLHRQVKTTVLDEVRETASANYNKWVQKWGIGRLYDMKAMPAEHLRAAMAGTR